MLSRVAARAQKVAVRGSVRTFAKWEVLVTPYTAKDEIESYKGLESQMTAMRSAVNSTPKEIPAIDFDYYSRNIKAAGVVDQLKKEYESFKFVAPEGQEDVGAVKEAYDKKVKESEKYATLTQAELARTQAELARAEPLIGEMPWRNLAVFYEFNPGFELQLRDDINESRYDLHPSYERLLTVDYQEMRKQLNAGKAVLTPGIDKIYGGDGIAGDFDLEEEVTRLEKHFNIKINLPRAPADFELVDDEEEHHDEEEGEH